MRRLAWDRNARIAEVRDRIWSYLSPSSRFEMPGLLVAAALLKWPEDDALRLAELQFLLSSEVGELLQEMPRLVRRLATASARDEELTAERLHGPIDWNATLALRASAGSRHLFVTAPARRVYQIPENELLVHVLDSIVRIAQRTGWDQILAKEGPAATVRERLSEATRWQQSRMLATINRARPTPRSLARIQSGRNLLRYAPLLGAYARLTSLVEQLDRQAVRAAVEHAGLVTADEATLLELLTTFRVIDELRKGGWQMQPFALFQGHVHTSGQRDDGRQIDLWYQSTPPDLRTGSRYRRVLTSHGFPRQGGLRPDLVLRWAHRNGSSRWLLIECKLSQSMGVGHAARQALADLLAYRRAFDHVLSLAGQPYGLGVAWGAELTPAASAEIALCTPDMLGEAIGQIAT
jgi:hypothetical protein